ncbi:hypothetical protein GCM10023069_03480 [Shinella granuli]
MLPQTIGARAVSDRSERFCFMTVEGSRKVDGAALGPVARRCATDRKKHDGDLTPGETELARNGGSIEPAHRA